MTPLSEIPTATLKELEQEFVDEDNLDELCDAHNDLIKVIIEKEEELITSHREHIDQVVDLIKSDMTLLQIVDQPNSDIEQYVKDLDRMLCNKVEMIGKIRLQLVQFYQTLKKEEQLQQLYAKRVN